MSEIYFDNNATTRPLPQVREEIMKVLGEDFGNPSSSHSTGERARKYLLSARQSLASLIGCDPENIVFTSSGTEANNLVFYSCTIGSKTGAKIVTTEIEHSSIIKMCSFLGINNVEIEYLKVDEHGLIDTNELKEYLAEDTDLVSVQWVNNETGVVQDLKEIIEICNQYNVPFHTDAAQAVGKLKFSLKDFDVDYLTLAGHKFHAPQGVGAIYVRDKMSLHPFLFGGFQEEGFRPGTENLPGIVGMGKACELRINNIDKTIRYMCELRSIFEDRILESIPGTKIYVEREHKICNTTNIMFGGLDGRKLLTNLDNEGIRCSQSSACTSYETAPSYVLKAMGLSDEEAFSSIRFSFSEDNTRDEIDTAVDIIIKNCEKLRI